MMEKEQKIVAIIQARMSSSRLPGKVLTEISGKPMLAYVVERARMSKFVDEVVVATTTDQSDDPIEAYCLTSKTPLYRGDLYDVLDRYYQTAKAYQADMVVRLTADCPLLDPNVLDETISAMVSQKADFGANRLPPPWKRTYPIGLDVEVCTFHALERAWQEAGEKYHREHVMPYLYEEEGRFKVVVIDHEPDYGHMRWTVDTQEDLDLIRELMSRLGNEGEFSWVDVLKIFEDDPQLAEINKSVQHKSAHDIDSRQESK
ncbi:MAG: glycosyltransferase family protein [Anaerolineaceae bacterium]|nr:glycosyltransferase family protein [Anaerolineaceae bacterium]